MEKISSNYKIQQQELFMLKEIDRIAKQYDLTYYLGYGTVLGAVRHNGFIPWDSDIDILVDINSYKLFCEILNSHIDSKYEVKSIDTDPSYNSLKARVSLKGSSHTIIHVDIFPMVGSPKSIIGKKIFSKIAYWNYRLYSSKKYNSTIYGKRTPKSSIFNILLLPIPSSICILIFNKLSTMFPIEQSKSIYNICGSYGYKEFFSKEWLGEAVYLKFEDHEFPVPKEWDKYLTHIYGDYMTPRKNNYV